jgi:hypothetical protein
MLRAVTVHVDRLHDDDVWNAVSDVAHALARHGRRATFCVDPAGVRAHGALSLARLDTLAVAGHELAHLSDAARPLDALEADREVFRAIGVLPQGFVTRELVTNDGVQLWLSTHAYRYDLSTRDITSTLDEPYVAPGVLQLATTHDLRDRWRVARFRQPPAVVDGLRYCVACVRDTDLARISSRVAFRAFLRVTCRGGVLPAVEVCEAVEARVAFR